MADPHGYAPYLRDPQVLASGSPQARIPASRSLYMDPAGDDNGPGSITDPLKTLDEALLRFSSGWSQLPLLFVNAGTYTIPLATGTSASRSALSIPWACGPNAFPLQMVCAYVDSGQGVLTVTAKSNGVVATFTYATVTVGAAAWVVNQFRGYRFRVVTGAGSGIGSVVCWVVSNTVNTLTLSTFQNVLGVGGTFVLETHGVTFDFPAGVTTVDGGALIARGANWRTPGQLAFRNQLYVEANWFTPNPGALWYFSREIINANAILQSRVTTIPGAFDPYLCDDIAAYFDTNTGFGIFADGASINLRNAVFQGCKQTIRYGSRSQSAINNVAQGASAVLVDESGTFAPGQFLMDAVTPDTTTGAAFSGVRGGQLEMFTTSRMRVQNTPATTAPGDGVLLDGAANSTISNLTGPGNAGTGVRNLRCNTRVTDANVGTTIAGVTQCVVGANAATTWALIAGGLAVNTTDQAAAASQLARLGP